MPNGGHPSPGELAGSKAQDNETRLDSLEERVDRLEEAVRELTEIVENQLLDR